MTESLEPHPRPTPWDWNHTFTFRLEDGAEIGGGVLLDGRGRLSLRWANGATGEYLLSPALRAALRPILIRAVDRGVLVP